MNIFIQRNGKCPLPSCLAILLNVGVISDWILISAQFDIDILDIDVYWISVEVKISISVHL